MDLTRKHLNSGFTLLEIMVSLAILAAAIIPLLYLREDSYSKALNTQSLRKAQELAKAQLAIIALEVRSGDGSGSLEGFDNFSFEYSVTLYDFGGGLATSDEENSGFGDNINPGDGVIPEDEETYGPMTMRHVELTIFYPSMGGGIEGDEEMMSEYVIDTYMPILLTEDQFDKKNTNIFGEDQ